MRKIFRSILLIAAAAMTFAGCQKNVEVDPAGTHTVTFTASIDADTKTIPHDEGDKMSYTWEDDGFGLFMVYENGTQATSVEYTLSADNKTATVICEFANSSATSYVYDASYCYGHNHADYGTPTEIYRYQGMDQHGYYDRRYDILIAKQVTLSARPTDPINFQFKRVIAFNQMTLKGLPTGASIEEVRVTSDKNIVGTYFMGTGEFDRNLGKEVAVYPRDTKGKTVVPESGEFLVWFITMPVENAQFSVEVDVLTDKVHTLSHTFSKPITLKEGGQNIYSVTVESGEPPIVEKLVTLSINDAVADNGYSVSSGTDIHSIIRSIALDDVVTMSTDGDPNCGTFWGSDTIDWRLYQNKGGNLTISLCGGYELDAVCVTYNSSNGGVLEDLPSNKFLVVSGSSVTFDVVNSGDATNGQVRVTKVDVRYKEVAGAKKTVQRLSFSEDPATGILGETFTAPTLSGAKTSLTYSSKYLDVATVNSTTGAVTLKSKGYTLITVTAAETDQYYGATASYALNVKEPAAALKTIDEIFNAAGSTAKDADVKFNNYVVSGVSSSNAFVTDGTKGFIIYQKDHGFEAGDILSGTVSCQVVLYNSSAELKGVTSSSEGLTVTKGGTVTPQAVSAGDLSAINTGAVVTISNAMFNGTLFNDGSARIYPYNTLYDYDSFVSGETYNVTGVYQQYNDKKEILPRSASDISVVEVTKYAVSIATVEHGTITASATKAAEGAVVTLTANPDSGYYCSAWDVKTKSGAPVEVIDGKFTMPASAVNVSCTFSKTGGGSSKTVSWTFSDMGYENAYEVGGLDKDGISVIFDKGTNSNATKYYVSGAALRCYGGNTIFIGADSGVITKIEFTFGASDGSNAITADCGSFSSPVWTGSSTTVNFTIGGTSGNRRIAGLSVTYQE